jgi:hypothetical protein
MTGALSLADVLISADPRLTRRQCGGLARLRRVYLPLAGSLLDCLPCCCIRTSHETAGNRAE